MKVFKSIKTHKYFWWFLSSLSFFIANLDPLLSSFSLLGVGLFLQAIFSGQDFKVLWRGSLLVGLGKYASALLFFWTIYPLTWLGIGDGWWQLLVIGIMWILFVLSLSVGMVFVSLVTKTIKNHVVLIFGFPLIFMIGELLGSLMFSFYALGPGSSLNTNMTFGYVGYAFSNIVGFINLAVCGGIYLVAFMGLLLTVSIYIYLIDENKNIISLAQMVSLFVLVCVVTTSVYVSQRPVVGDGDKVIALETYFSSDLLTTKQGPQIKESETLVAVESAVTYNPQIILLPEDSRLTSIFNGSEATYAFLQGLNYHGLLIDSARTETEIGTVLRSFIYDADLAKLATSDKQYLVPQGEYVPYLVSLALKVFGQTNILNELNYNQSYRLSTVVKNELSTPAPLVVFCFEDLNPLIVKKNLTGENSFVFHPVSHAWFHSSRLIDNQFLSPLRIQAVWNNRPIIQSGNMAPSMAYLPNGQVVRGELLTSTKYWSLWEFNLDK